MGKVSNPWREAIEVPYECIKEVDEEVSNPWREAIEENISDHKISYELLYSLTKEVYHKSVLVSSFHLSHCNMFL